MALPRWIFLLLLTTLLAAKEEEEQDPNISGEGEETEKCQQPQWDSKLHFTPHKSFYRISEEVTLSCSMEDPIALAVIRCAKGAPPKYDWEMDSQGTWHGVAENLTCTTETCQRPQWDTRLQLKPDQDSYQKYEEVMLSCLKGFQPPFTHVKCIGKNMSNSNGKPEHREVWLGKDSRGQWNHTQDIVECIETCQRPLWDTRLQLAPDQSNYKTNKEVMLSCPEGFQPSFTHVKCSRVHSVSHGNSEVWFRKDSRGRWKRIPYKVVCIEVLHIDPRTLEVSSTSIKVNWSCRIPEACSHMRATCRLAWPSSPPCEAEEVLGEEMLHGQAGTFSCPALQPFTEYSVTISLLPGTILFTWLVRTTETVPDKPEKLWLDPSTGSLSWEPLPSCKGEIIGYQVPGDLGLPVSSFPWHVLLHGAHCRQHGDGGDGKL
ncbi:uncharacterized protein LOC134164553 isoform X2 [Pezoporus occidentalis]|uniref:uncharacterized protein LOC134164553 isoform X2 n=1 Tax=Pezoporus occidentalis TaxID=407982 RepID=UPI002F90A097